MLRRSFVVAGLCVAVAGSASATPYAGEFLAVGIGARPLGMGGAFVALVDDATATYWNAAALPRNQSRELVYMHSERFGGLVNYDSGSFVFRTREASSGARSAFGIGFLMTSIPGILFNSTDPEDLIQIESGSDGDFDVLDADGSQGNGQLDPGERLNLDYLAATANEVTDRELGVLLSYGRTRVFREDMSMGGSVKFVRKSVGDYSAWGMGLDLAVLWQASPAWAVGLNVQDITTTFLDWKNTASESREYITPTAKLGTAYTWTSDRIAGSLTGAMDLDARFEDEVGTSTSIGGIPVDVRAGVEYWYRQVLALRVGSERLGGGQKPLTAGAGLRVNRFSFDYAYRNHSELDDVHRISGGISF